MQGIKVFICQRQCLNLSSVDTYKVSIFSVLLISFQPLLIPAKDIT